MKQFEQIILIVLSALLLFILGADYGKRKAELKPVPPFKERVDTLYLHDTISLSTPVFVKERIVDTMLVAVTDTIVRNDTTYLYLPKQQRQYHSSEFDAWVSGYDPKLDSINLYNTTKVVTKEIPVKVKSKWGIGIHAGYGASEYGITPYIGVGLSYNILSW